VTQVTGSRGRRSRSPVSLLLSKADRYASRPAVAVFVVTAAGAWLIVSVVAGFPTRWETIFQTAVAALTLAMVFVIQHTQGRHQRAIQRKLDEILLAMPGANDALVTLEHASDDELHAAAHEHLSIRQAALEDESPPHSDGLG
jgi:low affinity Fe/Cu permease